MCQKKSTEDKFLCAKKFSVKGMLCSNNPNIWDDEVDLYLYKTLMSKKEKVFAAAHEELENSRNKMIDRYAKRMKTKETEFKVGSKVQYRNLSFLS